MESWAHPSDAEQRENSMSQCLASLAFTLLATILPQETTTPRNVTTADGSDASILCEVEVDSVLNSRFPPTMLFDGQLEDPASRWASSRAAVPHWISLELEHPVSLDGMTVQGHDDSKGLALVDADVQFHHEGAWKNLAEIRDNRQAQIKFCWPRSELTKLRLHITRACRYDHTARLFEVTLYDGDMPIPLQVRYSDDHLQSLRPPQQRVDDERLLASVSPFMIQRMDPTSHTQRNQETLQNYYDSILAWTRLLGENHQAVPNHSGWGYYGDGGNTENSVRPICYAALTNAFLSVTEPPHGGVTSIERDELRGQAVAALKYLTQAHLVNGGSCLNGRTWGRQWQSAMWARSLGLAGWLLWEHLDTPMRLAVARVVEYEADRFLDVNPKSSLVNDTGAEENAWNAGLIALACCMMPDHPRAEQWDVAAKRYMYNTFSVAADANDESIGDNGRLVCDWVSTINAHPDFTVENHGLVHVGYLKNAHALLLEAASPYIMTGRPFPQAGKHHADDVYDVLLNCIDREGAPIYFGGNDWKLVHTQCSDVINFALTNLLFQDPRAARIESVALDWLRRIQDQREGYYTIREDLEHNGLVASRLATCYLAHAQMGEGASLCSEEEFEESIAGVTRLEHGRAILHQTPSKFVSFAWGSQRMALVMPHRGDWTVWPHCASYLGLINGQDASQNNADLLIIDDNIQPDYFTVTGSLQRCDGQVTQDFAIASLKQDVVIYIERLRVKDGFSIDSRETGIVGHEYPLESNRRDIYGDFGRQEIVGRSDQEGIYELNSRWLNLGERIGYVVLRQEGCDNLIRYHDQKEGEGRVPKLQEWFSLIGECEPHSISSDNNWAAVVTFLNQTPEETAEWASQSLLEIDGHGETCYLSANEIHVDFSAFKTTVVETPR